LNRRELDDEILVVLRWIACCIFARVRELPVHEFRKKTDYGAQLIADKALPVLQKELIERVWTLIRAMRPDNVYLGFH
jgi:hypothetical protein